MLTETCESDGMELTNHIAPWLTPVIIIGLFMWLRSDIRTLEERLDKRFDAVDKRFDGMDRRIDGLDERLRAVEAGLAEVRGQLVIVRDYILRRNLREPDDAPEAAVGY